MAWREYRDLMRQMEYDLHRFTEEAFDFFETPNRFWQPAADVHETDAGIVIKIEVAGATAESLNVSLSGDGQRLLVAGVRSERKEERASRVGCHQLEIYFGPFERNFALPTDWEIDRDGISATLKDGFLTITLPRQESAAVPTRQIPIEVE